MNLDKLKRAEEIFLGQYPGGFSDPLLQPIAKRHNADKMAALAQEQFAKARFSDPVKIVESMTKLVGRSSMVSYFEKPRFRDYALALEIANKKTLSGGLRDFIHGDQERGFAAMLEVLAPAKLAKWSLITILPNYYAPNHEVFVKPTTTKGAIAMFELDVPPYQATPTWHFYERYREVFMQMRGKLDSLLSPHNAAFGGFLMMTTRLLQEEKEEEEDLADHLANHE